MLPAALHSAPSSWHPIYLIPVGGFNAFAVGVGLFELTCWAAPGVARLVEGKYCFSVQVLFGVFAVLQTIAYLASTHSTWQ